MTQPAQPARACHLKSFSKKLGARGACFPCLRRIKSLCTHPKQRLPRPVADERAEHGGTLRFPCLGGSCVNKLEQVGQDSRLALFRGYTESLCHVLQGPLCSQHLPMYGESYPGCESTTKFDHQVYRLFTSHRSVFLSGLPPKHLHVSFLRDPWPCRLQKETSEQAKGIKPKRACRRTGSKAPFVCLRTAAVHTYMFQSIRRLAESVRDDSCRAPHLTLLFVPVVGSEVLANHQCP